MAFSSGPFSRYSPESYMTAGTPALDEPRFERGLLVAFSGSTCACGG